MSSDLQDEVAGAAEPDEPVASDTLAVTGPPPPAKKMTPLRAFGLAISSYKELGRTPYGKAPTVLFAVGGVFAALNGAAFSLAGPFLLRRGIDVSALVQVSLVVGGVALYLHASGFLEPEPGLNPSAALLRVVFT